MSLALVPASPPPPLHNIEAEQAVLGCLMNDNAVSERLQELKPDHMFDPFHGRLLAAIYQAIGKGMADPLILMERFRHDPAFQELGGLRYLAQLVDLAPPGAAAPWHAQTIIELAKRREMIRIAGEMVEAAQRSDLPSKEQIEAAEQALYGLAETGASAGGFEALSGYVAGALNMTAEAYSRDGRLSGLTTGLMDLDRKLGGLHPSDLIILASRPSMGKTSLGTNVAYSAARTGAKVGFFSLEMSGEQLAMRLLAEVSGVPSDKQRRGEITPVEFGRIRDAALEIESLPLYIDGTGALDISQIAARARRLKRTVGLDLLIVDYLQLAAANDQRGEGRVQVVTAITGGLKALAKELSIPVLALSQLSRKVEDRDDKRPQLSDLRESGSIEQDADVVMFIYREAYYLGRTEPKPGSPEHMAWSDQMSEIAHVAELIIGKQRHGPIGTVKLHFNEELTKFSNLAREGRFDQQPGRLPYAGDH